MRGQVLGVDVRNGEGQIAGSDGQRYAFVQTDWAHRGEPAIGLEVDFEPDHRRARNVFPLLPANAARVPAAPARPTTDRSRIVAAVLAFFIGTLGIHRFYLRRRKSAVLMLVLSVTVVGLLLTGPWALIDMVRYLMMSEEDFAARYPAR